MAIPTFFCFGYVYNNYEIGDAEGATVLASGSLGTASDTTDSDGGFVINIEGICNNGEDITITATDGNKTDYVIWTVDISKPTYSHNFYVKPPDRKITCF